jgi:nitrate reductase NapE
MPTPDDSRPIREQTAPGKGDERLAFWAIAVALGPVAAVLIVGGFGFVVWMSQIIAGPPTG